MNIEMESNVKMFLMDVNAASRLLGEVLAAQRRAEMNLQQLLQIVHNLDKIRTEIRNTKKGLILTPRDCVALGTAFTVGLTISIFETIRLSGWIVPESYFSSFFFFVLSSAVWISCAAGRFFFLKKLEQKLEKQSQNIENMERQRNRLIRICFPSREKEVLEFQNAETSELCTKEIQRIQKVIGILEKELQESESMGAIASKRSAILLESRQFKAHLHKLGKTYKEAKARRAEVLKSLQLPETWNSSNIRQLLDASDRMRELWRRRSRDLEDFHLYSQELAVLVERLQMLLENFGEDFAKSQHATDERFPFQADIFKNIRTKITEVQSASNQASEMKKKINVIQKNRKKIQTEIQKLSQERGRLLANSGVSDEKMLSQKLVKLGTLRNLRSQRRDLQKKMDAVIDFTCSESVLWNLYEKNSPEQIAEKKKVSLNVLSELEFQKEAVETRLKECSTILSTILTDDSPTRLQYELMETEARIGHCINRWRTYATAQRLMETIQKTYQQKRQPQTLERASIYVQEMTEKKYVRVWTPVDEDILYVEQADGTRFSAEQLSTGTRELLYLAIRLALIEEYRTEGVILPVVLDDVLVNFDHRRAAAAAKVLTRFAGQKTQILFFTSHEHIREIFEKENALICNMEKRTKD